MMKKLLIVLFCCFSLQLAAQSDSAVIKHIFNEALTDHSSMDALRHLCKNIGGRICGSPEAAEAVTWTAATLKQYGADTVWLQELMVRTWRRGAQEFAVVNSAVKGKSELSICALGGSSGTGEKGLTAGIIEVHSLGELDQIPDDSVAGKIVFFNRPADPRHIYTFAAYGGAADQRVHGASAAARKGAAGAIVRSVTLTTDDFPHTGIMYYDSAVAQIPAVAISTLDADLLSDWLAADKNLEVHIRTTCHELPESPSHNVIAELKGYASPDTVIVIGAHIDAWDNGQGAHDDGVGVVQVMEVLRIFRKTGIRLKHTLRVVEFMDEEVAQRGAVKYAEYAATSGRFHLAAIETDRGGFSPRGFSYDGGAQVQQRIEQWKPLLFEYGLYLFYKGGSGVDIGPLKKQGIPLLALVPDSQRYFDYQHAPSDVFEAVNERELQLGAASIAAMVYLIDRYGW